VALILAGLLFHWRTTRRRTAADEDTPPEAELQVRKLLRFVIILTVALGLYGIWSQAVPTLQIFKRVQIWPVVTVLEPMESDALVLSSTPETAATETPEEGQASGAPKVPLPSVPADDPAAALAAAQADGSPLTLWTLLEAILVGLITAVLVRNLPGLLELVLQRRTALDSGARIAFSTLTRYVVMIVGVSVAFGLLGISWSKIQWLVAALTFGLGFGLQEIVANFVSGLILLTERPVRVGDAVTVGNLQGQVSRIRIRATTIALWDRSEMIVPNKEFITTKLVNWTLSDSRRRLDIPVRVAYGSDLEQVKTTLLQVAREHPGVLEDPPSRALLMSFGTDAINFELQCFVDFGQGLKTKDGVQMALDRAFRENGIEFALPQLQLKMHRAGNKA
jgi:potassium efflux system protein